MATSNEWSYSSYGPGSSYEDHDQRPISVAITGGCGFLGRHIAKSLYNEIKDVRITLVDVVPADTTVMTFITEGVPLGQPVCFSLVGRDVTRLPHLLKVFKETDIVFHCAARTDALSSTTKMSLVNIDGTRNVIRACKECGVSALVYSGSLVQALKAGVTTQHGISESAWENTHDRLINPSLARSKNEAEQLVLDSCDNTLYTCSIRCPPLYGEFDNSLVPSAIALANVFGGFYPNCGDPSMRMVAMYAGNAAWAHVCAAKKLLDQSTRKFISGHFFYVGDDTPCESYTTFFMRFLKRLGYSQTFCVPLIVLEIFLSLLAVIVMIFSIVVDLQRYYFVFGYRRRIPLLSISHTLVWRRAQIFLGYKPKFKFHKALELSIRNYCATGHLR